MTEQTTTVTNDDGVTITFDPRVIAQGARVRFATAVATRHSGSDDEVTVPPGALGTVLEYVDGFYQCIVRLDAPLRDTSRRDVWASPDDLGIVPDRFAFDRDAAAPILAKIAAYHEDADADVDLATFLDADRATDADNSLYFLGDFAPHEDYEHGSNVYHLIAFAWDMGWLTGPDVPYYDLDGDGDYAMIGHNRGEAGKRLGVTDGWTNVDHLIDYPEGSTDKRNEGPDAALDLLTNMVACLNDGIDRLDAYVATQIAKQPDPYSDLLDAATTDYEREVLDELRRKAGLIVACACGWDIGREQETCDGCGQPRPATDETKAA